MVGRAKGNALVTGASARIGAVYADRLAAGGFDLVLVARNRARLDDLAAGITDRMGRTVEGVAADLASKPDLARVERVLATDADIRLLVNNAGIGASVPT